MNTHPKMNGPRPVMRPVRPVAKPAAPVKPPVAEDNNSANPTDTPPPATPPVAKQPKPVKPKKEKSGSGVDGAKVVMGIIIVVLLGAIGYLVYDKFDTQGLVAAEVQKSESFKIDINNKLAEINRLQDSLRTVISEKEKLGLELSEERAKLAELDDLKAQIQNKQVSINALNSKLSKYKKEYQNVAASIESLTAENKQLASEKEAMAQQLKAKEDSLKGMLAVNSALNGKVALASALKMESVNVVAITTSGKELKPAETYKAMIVGKIKMTVKLAENNLAQGKKDIYLRIIEPGGSTLYDGEKHFLVEGRKTYYTEKQTIDLGAGNTATFLHIKGNRYKPGKYTLEFFADGKKIGTGSLTLTQ